MRVSVVVPCWNEEPAYLERAVLSASAPDSEVIVVDDGSTRDDTIKCLSGLRARTVRLAHGGPARAINVGCEMATGRYLLTLGSDDWISGGFGSRLASALDGDSGTTIAYTTWREFGVRDREHVPPPSVTPQGMAEACPIVATSLFRKESWEALGGFDETLQEGFEDWEWWVRLLLQQGGVGRHVPGATFHYRIKSQSRNISNTKGVGPLRQTRLAMLRNNPDHHRILAQAMAEDYEKAYLLGQNQSPLAAAATEQARYWAARYGRLEGARMRVARMWARRPRVSPT